MAGILVDTFAWIEIFEGSPPGRRALELIEEEPSISVSVLTLYELQYRLGKLYGEEKTGSVIGTILSHAVVIPVDTPIAIAAGSIKSAQKKNGSAMGAVDCLILATARLHGLKILSGDRRIFPGSKNASIFPVPDRSPASSRQCTTGSIRVSFVPVLHITDQYP